ncbi:MAG: tRNA (N(6)-L-threonylcarbamoyladenosine(37)-C(2))-methylthiotransferase MtaB [Lachnospiraceae bacterium]|nr:tRNA (N(6)-L-threonylcarbamoyladenosine(37)-C(2))-methylthiotransferase MtaB [Lachnospiraceae bacterium]
MVTVALHTLGCKVNACESEKIEASLKEAGFLIVPFSSSADVYIVNTCSVTNIADRKSRQLLHRAKKLNPDALIIAAGCYVNTRGREEVTADPLVDLAFSNEEKTGICAFLKERFSNRLSSEGAADTSLFSLEHTRVFLKVQDGCDMFCSYCVIPYARGRIKSIPEAELIREVTSLASHGYREFILTGIHLSSYGKDLPEGKTDLMTLIRSLSGISGVRRLRLGSLEPGIITEDFARFLSEIPALCPHFHLSLQSGSDSVLKRMNRKYDTKRYAESVKLLRQYFDDPAITTDVIVGFPGESDTEFEETVSFLKRIGFYETHVFQYSRRAGTAADRMPGQLSSGVKAEREKVLLRMTEERRKAYADSRIGKDAEVLFEENNEGYTKEYIRVRCMNPDAVNGSILYGTITGRENNRLMSFEPRQL